MLKQGNLQKCRQKTCRHEVTAGFYKIIAYRKNNNLHILVNNN
jgi:hypothetical protein